MVAPDFRNVPGREGDETKEAVFRGDRGKYGEGLLGIWDITDGNSFVQVPGAIVVILRQRLLGNGAEPPEEARKWGRLAKILVREGADRRMVGRFMWR